MPLIEELPINTVTRVSHGWAYVPDNALQSSQPLGRKRGRDAKNPSSASVNAKLQKAIQQRLRDLEKENYKDVQIPIPKREGREKQAGKKITPNVRRILQYSRTFQHYLADEEAALAQGNIAGSSLVHTTIQPVVSGGVQKIDSRRRGTATVASEGSSRSTPNPIKRGRPSQKKRQSKSIVNDEVATPSKEEDIEMTDSPVVESLEEKYKPLAETTNPESVDVSIQSTKPAYDPALDKDPLLRTRDLPKMPSDRVMDILISEPPLTYNAARAVIPSEDRTSSIANPQAQPPPPRHFCAICGYWGKICCRKCGERICGLLECWRGHEAVCTAAF